MDSKRYNHRSSSSHKSKDDNRIRESRDRDKDKHRYRSGRSQSRSPSRSRSRSRSYSRSRSRSRDRSHSNRRKKSPSESPNRGRGRDRDHNRDHGRDQERDRNRKKNEADVLTGKAKSLPPVSKRDVEDCMDELELKMEKSRRSQEENVEKLEGVNPSKDDVSTNILIDYRLGGNDLFLGARFIFECGIKLELRPTTIATAAVLYHKFWSKTDVKTYDVCTIGATSVLIACKVENEKRRMRDLINVVHQSVERDSELLDMDDKYFVYKNGIIQAELFMMRILEFQVTYEHPHRYLVHYLRELQNWMGYECVSNNSIFRTAWSILQDLYHDPSILNYKPQELAIAAIDTSLSAFGAIIPGDKPKAKNGWKNVFFADFSEDTNREIIMKMFDIYDKEAEYIPSLVYDKNQSKSTPNTSINASTADTTGKTSTMSMSGTTSSTLTGATGRGLLGKPAAIPERESAMMSGMNPVPPPPPKLFH